MNNKNKKNIVNESKLVIGNFIKITKGGIYRHLMTEIPKDKRNKYLIIENEDDYIIFMDCETTNKTYTGNFKIQIADIPFTKRDDIGFDLKFLKWKYYWIPVKEKELINHSVSKSLIDLI